jgi:hypothetical protein
LAISKVSNQLVVGDHGMDGCPLVIVAMLVMFKVTQEVSHIWQKKIKKRCKRVRIHILSDSPGFRTQGI